MKRLLTLGALACTLLHAELFTDHFKNGIVKSRIEYKDGTRTKTKEGIKHGMEKVYYDTGALAYEVRYVNGKREGVMKWYDQKGNLLETITYRHGLRHGPNTLYYSNGKKRAEVNYIDDKKEGLYREYFSTGELALEVNYKNGKKEGVQKEYHRNGKLASKVNYINGYKEGEQIWYDKEGKRFKHELYKMDRPIETMKKIQAKQPDATQQLLQGLDFNPNHHKAR